MINWQNGVTPINETNMNKIVQEDMITDAYSSSSTYAVGDYCIYGNTLYKCTTAISTAEEFDSSKWEEVNVMTTVRSLIENILLESDKKKYHVGKIIIETDNRNPATYLGFGTWQYWGSGRVLVGVDTSQTEFNTVEKTGGEKTHQLTVDEMPSHSHNTTNHAGAGSGSLSGGYNWGFNIGDYGTLGTESAGGDQPHNNLQPYITCYMWKRTA